MKKLFHLQLSRLERLHPEAMVLLLDSGGYYKYANHHSQTIMGYEPGEIVGRHALEFAVPEDVPHAQLALEDAMLNYESVTVNIRVQTKAGYLQAIRGAAYRLDDPDNGETFFVGWVERT